MNWTKGLKNKVGCETWNKYIEKIHYENLIRIRFHINNLDERTIQKRMRETFNLDIRWELFKWDKRMKLDKLLVNFVKLIKLESKNSYYFGSDETQTCCNNKRKLKRNLRHPQINGFVSNHSILHFHRHTKTDIFKEK